MALHRNLRYLVANPILNCEDTFPSFRTSAFSSHVSNPTIVVRSLFDFVQMNRPVICTMFLVIFPYQVSCPNTNAPYSVNEASDANQGDEELISGYIRENYENPQ
eukprot:951327_1